MALFSPTISTLLSNIALGGTYLLKPMEIVFDLFGYVFSNLIRQRFLFLFICIFLFIISFGIFLKIFLGNNVIINRARMDFNEGAKDIKTKLSRIERIERRRNYIISPTIKNKTRVINKENVLQKQRYSSHKKYNERQYTEDYLNSFFVDISEVEL